MKVIIKNKFFSLRGNSSVKDENGKDIFYVKGRLISPTRVKWICDKNGTKLYKVRNKFWTFFNKSAYVYEGWTKVARVKHPFLNFKKFVVQGYKDEILIDGNFFSPESTITRNGKVAGKITRKVDWTDAFELEAEETDMPFMIALVIAIDNIFDSH